MTVRRNEHGQITARMSIRDLSIVGGMFITAIGFIWSIKLDLAVVRSEVRGHEKEINNHEARIDRLETAKR